MGITRISLPGMQYVKLGQPIGHCGFILDLFSFAVNFIAYLR
jgi:hypothetical protein